MFGAIIGDVVGSRFEFSNTSDYGFELFSTECAYTDDTICSVAVADALLTGSSFKDSFLLWCHRYPHPMGSYGGGFLRWLFDANPQPYDSFGNGAAMRVSPVAWAEDNRDAVIRTAIATAQPTHNHAEGLKGAVVTALGIYFLRTHDTAFDTLVSEYYGTDWEAHLPQEGYFDITCQGCVPLAFHILSQSDSFEDAIRRAIIYGGDSDTMAAIVGSLAEARYGVDDAIVCRALTYLPDDMLSVVLAFRKKYC